MPTADASETAENQVAAAENMLIGKLEKDLAEAKTLLASSKDENDQLKQMNVLLNESMSELEKQVAALKSSKPKKASSHCQDSKGNSHKVVEVLQAQELAERLRKRELPEEGLVGILASATEK